MLRLWDRLDLPLVIFLFFAPKPRAHIFVLRFQGGAGSDGTALV